MCIFVPNKFKINCMMRKALAILMMCTMFVLSCSDEDSGCAVQEPTSIEGFINREVLSDGPTAIVSSKGVLQAILPEGGYRAYSKEVNFSKNNLLLVYDTSTSGIYKITKKLTKTKDGYDIDITVHQNMLCVMEPWCIAYIVPKKLSRKDVKVKIEYEESM